MGGWERVRGPRTLRANFGVREVVYRAGADGRAGPQDLSFISSRAAAGPLAAADDSEDGHNNNNRQLASRPSLSSP